MTIFPLSNGWEIAHFHIHEAFDHLISACLINEETANYYLNIKDKIKPSEYISVTLEMDIQLSKEYKELIKAIVFFQAGIEAWISWAYTQKPLKDALKNKKFDNEGKFVSIWLSAFEHLGCDYDFTAYKKFYIGYRNPIVHPTSINDINAISSINFKKVLEGFKAGWGAMAALSQAFHIKDENDFFPFITWEQQCEELSIDINKLYDFSNYRKDLISVRAKI